MARSLKRSAYRWSRRVIDWAIDKYLHTDLVQAALAMAVAMCGELADEPIVHADRGCQYTPEQLARVRLRAQPGPLSWLTLRLRRSRTQSIPDRQFIVDVGRVRAGAP